MTNLALCWTVITLVWLIKTSAGQGIMGESVKCSKEGKVLKTLRDPVRNQCIVCICKNGIADCSATCPKLPDSCTVYEYEKNSCCRICKGCAFKNRYYRHDEKWTIYVKDDKKSYWKRLICQNGLITMHKIECHVPCKSPIYLDKHECPICEKCKYHGVKYNEGEVFAPLADKSIICTCQEKVLTCMRKVCPILSCHPNTRTIIEYEPGLVCQMCSTLPRKIVIPGSCIVNNMFMMNGQSKEIDSCTRCKCRNSTAICNIKVAPATSQCERRKEDSKPCSKCLGLSPTGCELNGFRYQNGSRWVDGCKNCSCNNKAIKCSTVICPILSCPKGSQPYHVPGKCCPIRCFAATDTCHVYKEFNSAFIRTFDNYSYKINDGCKYIIAKSCNSKFANFTIEGRFGSRSIDSRPLLSHVYLYIGNSKQVVLLPTMRVKYNRRSISLPYQQSNLLRIEATSALEFIKITTNFGLQLIFGKKSDLKIYASPDYNNDVCGICGNYNGNKKDDISISNQNDKTKLKDFLLKWKIGKGCNKFKSSYSVLPTSCKNFLPQKAAVVCMWIYQVDFLPCTIDRYKYHQQCLDSTCNDCSYINAEACACKIQKKYAQDCLAIKGINIRWDNYNRCAEWNKN